MLAKGFVTLFSGFLNFFQVFKNTGFRVYFQYNTESKVNSLRKYKNIETVMKQ